MPVKTTRRLGKRFHSRAGHRQFEDGVSGLTPDIFGVRFMDDEAARNVEAAVDSCAVELPLAAGAVVETAVEELIVQSVRTASAQTMTSAKHGVASAHLVTGSHVFLVCCRRKPGVANRGSGSMDGHD